MQTNKEYQTTSNVVTFFIHEIDLKVSARLYHEYFTVCNSQSIASVVEFGLRISYGRNIQAHHQLDAGHCAAEEQHQFAVGFATTLGGDFGLAAIAGAFNVAERK
uniref:Uncharacterized protein n=1 Tax=Romanomermis culicivorax TaxID=13658 RepID=A0A915L2X4_ROMCU